MVIILDTDGFSAATYRGHLEQSLFVKLALALPHNQFVCTSATDIQHLVPNISVVEFPVQKGLFHQKKTEKWLRQQQASAFISFKRMLKTAHPLQQVLIIASEEQLHNEKAVRLATVIGISSEGLIQLFNEKYPDLHEKTILLNGIVEQNAPVYKTADDIRETIASGREYFILADFNLTQDKLTTVLKGFSAFKRMLHSSWKFMVVLRSEETISRGSVEQLLSNYKYREDIIVTNGDLLHEKLRDAYALVSMDSSERLPVPVIEAWRAHIPAVVQETQSVRAVLEDLAVYIEGNTSEAVGELLMKMYKDENFRQNLIQRLKSTALLQDPDAALQALIRVLQ